ncbi:MAG: hypothetical protein Q4P30_05330 [Eubacteriales bacterium]|nr:hypothetical protein [Eubacteriales bacterium]
MKKYAITAALMICFTVGLFGCGKDAMHKNRLAQDECPQHRQDEYSLAKPVIYLYPTQKTDVFVRLDYTGILSCTYPAYENGWRVTAEPDGTLTDSKTGREYYGLFWEGRGRADFDFRQGFVIPGRDTAVFLEDALAKLGLNETEAQEFIVYWLPQMQDNPYNLISFQQERYTDIARLNIEPKPDTVIRVFMAWQPVNAPMDDLPVQTLSTPERQGFTVVEWGGSKCNDS